MLLLIIVKKQFCNKNNQLFLQKKVCLEVEIIPFCYFKSRYMNYLLYIQVEHVPQITVYQQKSWCRVERVETWGLPHILGPCSSLSCYCCCCGCGCCCCCCCGCCCCHCLQNSLKKPRYQNYSVLCLDFQIPCSSFQSLNLKKKIVGLM